ncbi:MAG: sugar ABC transporter permease, partial [Cellulomonadaceae bacterium]|nr:sugar ABC transporter permease [Cellulomonadaceae bacterium]
MTTLVPKVPTVDLARPENPQKRRRNADRLYPHWFLAPGAAIYTALF